MVEHEPSHLYETFVVLKASTVLDAFEVTGFVIVQD